jgi:hypothetical protein
MKVVAHVVQTYSGKLFPKGSLLDEQMKTWWYIHTVKYYSAIGSTKGIFSYLWMYFASLLQHMLYHMYPGKVSQNIFKDYVCVNTVSPWAFEDILNVSSFIAE